MFSFLKPSISGREVGLGLFDSVHQKCLAGYQDEEALFPEEPLIGLRTRRVFFLASFLIVGCNAAHSQPTNAISATSLNGAQPNKTSFATNNFTRAPMEIITLDEKRMEANQQRYSQARRFCSAASFIV